MNGSPNVPIRVVLADDHDLVRSGIRILLDGSGIVIAGEARNGEELLAVVRGHRPDVVLTDIDMPAMDGLRATRLLRKEYPGLRILVLTMHDDQALLRDAIAHGADGYLLKSAPATELAQAVRSVLSTGYYFSSDVARLLLQRGEPAPDEQLTQRQVEVLKRLASGESAKEIGFNLGLSAKTVDAHRAHLMRRLGIGDVAGLTRYAIRTRLVSV